jgi:hypothetical protein
MAPIEGGALTGLPVHPLSRAQHRRAVSSLRGAPLQPPAEPRFDGLDVAERHLGHGGALPDLDHRQFRDCLVHSRVIYGPPIQREDLG